MILSIKDIKLQKIYHYYAMKSNGNITVHVNKDKHTVYRGGTTEIEEKALDVTNSTVGLVDKHISINSLGIDENKIPRFRVYTNYDAAEGNKTFTDINYNESGLNKLNNSVINKNQTILQYFQNKMRNISDKSGIFLVYNAPKQSQPIIY
jgi:hypothetical protein